MTFVSSPEKEHRDRARALRWSVGLVYAVAWCVKVIKDGDTLADGKLPGWQALRFSLAPILDRKSVV